MKKQDALFQLIKSLTRGEKRNFRILAQLTSGDKKYLQLFDVIDNMEEYDEQKVLKKFKRDDKFEKQFAYNKNYLYNTILNALAYFHKGFEAEMSSITLHVRILLEKNLFFQAKKLLNKAKEAAMAQEKFEELMKILWMEVEILKSTENIKVLPDALREVEFNLKVTVDKISNLMNYRLLENQIYLLLNTRHIARKEDEQCEADKILGNGLLQEETAALSNRARILYNEIRRGIAYYKGDHETALHFATRSVAIYEAAPSIMEEAKLQYLQHYAMHVHHVIFMYGPEAAIPLLAKLREVKFATPQERVMRFEKYHIYSMALIVATGDTATETFLKEFEEELDVLENDLAVTNRLRASYLHADYYVIHGQYSKALGWSNKFLNHPRTNLRTDMQAGMRLINLLIHYELGNYDLMEYHLKSAYRYIYKQERMHKYERRFLRFFKDVLAVQGQDHQELMRTFREDILEITKDPFEDRATQIFNVVCWLDSKIDGITMAEAKRKQADLLLGNKEKIVAGGPAIRPPRS